MKAAAYKLRRKTQFLDGCHGKFAPSCSFSLVNKTFANVVRDLQHSLPLTFASYFPCFSILIDVSIIERYPN